VLDTAAADDIADDIADVNNKTAVSHYIKNINPTASPFEVENILKWIEALKGDEVVISAIDEAVMCNHRSLRYIEKILQRCEKQGIYTSEAFIAQKEISKKSRDGEMKVKQTAFNGYEQRDYTEEELEEIVKRKRRRGKGKCLKMI
jgi:DnaD/phage-associated family protein